MQTNIRENLRNTADGTEAERILRSCVHCGFCTATCPTYRLLGDELDGPRGRIYLIKGLLEGKDVSQQTQTHLDRCLTCLACETTCPSGVEYGHLLDIGRQQINEKVKRTLFDRCYRYLIRQVLPYPRRFSFLLGMGRSIRFLLPEKFRRMIPVKVAVRKAKLTSTDSLADSLSGPEITGDNPVKNPRKMILFSGCVQPSLSPQTNVSASRLLNLLGIETIVSRDEKCCGAVDHHMAVEGGGLFFIKSNIDSWWPEIEAGVEAIVISASGCGAMIKDYGYLLRGDPVYKDKAHKVSMLAKDLGEIIAAEDIDKLRRIIHVKSKKFVFQNPCSLQHGQKLEDKTKTLLEKIGYKIYEVEDANQCCGSAGTYSLLQTKMSEKLRRKKIETLESVAPDVIMTANIGCQLHLQQATDIPVKHWIEVLEEDVQS